MPRRTGVMAALIALLVVEMLPGLAEARTNNRTKPVLFIHGLDALGDPGADCATYWNDMERKFRDWGHTGPLVELSFYRYDTNCDHTINHHSSHSRHYASGHYSTGGHGANTDIRHLGYHLAWYIYDHYSSAGTTVDVVGHSMGGLIIRYGLAQTQRGNADFPPYLYVEDVTTLGTPHAGSNWSGWCFLALQCNEIYPTSSFQTWLRDYAQNPQGSGGTDWTAIASYDDGLVSETSGVAMDANHASKYLGSMDYGHSDYYKKTSDARDADVEYYDRGSPWKTSYNEPHGVRWSDFASTYGSW